MTTPTPEAVVALRLFQRAVEAAWGDETHEEIVEDCIATIERGGLEELRRIVEEQEAEGDD